jgi:hypothetical protein
MPRTGNIDGGFFTWDATACGNACQRIIGTDWEKVRANERNGKSFKKKVNAGCGLETIWEISGKR